MSLPFCSDYRLGLRVFLDNDLAPYAGTTREAEAVERRLHEAWRHANVVLTASRF